MDSLSDAMKKRLDRQHLDQALSAASKIEIVRRVLPSYVVPKTLAHSTLMVEIDTPVHAYFFKQELEDYIERINAALGTPAVTTVKIWITHTPPPLAP